MRTALSFCVFPILILSKLTKLIHIVGTTTGVVMVWELGTREKLVQRNFKVWDLKSCSMPLQVGSVSIFSKIILCYWPHILRNYVCADKGFYINVSGIYCK